MDGEACISESFNGKNVKTGRRVGIDVDMLVAAGFADPVMDMEMITLTYAGPRGLLRDQRRLGVRDALFGRLAWRDWRRVLRHYATRRVDDRLPASFEVIYGHAWKPQPRAAADGRAIVRFEPRKK
jgi:malonyl-CoA O-methyltransferase